MEKLKILVIGSGGREYAVARAFSKENNTVYVAPGNDELALIGAQKVPIQTDDFKQLKDFVIENKIDWTFVGPETALVSGIVDYFQSYHLKIFGPTSHAAKLEGSKAFALEFMDRYQIPHPKYVIYKSESKAIKASSDLGYPLVIKVDGLAGGKGVSIASNAKEAKELIKNAFKDSDEVVLQEYLTGQEYSILTVINHDQYEILPIAQDHKQVYDGDRGPNTGGMGAYSPVPLSQNDYFQIINDLVKPAVKGLEQEKFNYCGILYLGIMMTKFGPKMIEYNVRLGDPETQIILPRLKTSFTELIDACVNNKRLPSIVTKPVATLGVVVAASGYPQFAKKGQVLPILHKNPNIYIDYANVVRQNNDLIANGGRLFMVCSSADNLDLAQENVYHYLAMLNLTNCFYRHDIGYKATKKKY